MSDLPLTKGQEWAEAKRLEGPLRRVELCRGEWLAASQLLDAAIRMNRSDVMAYRANCNRFQADYEWAIRDLQRVRWQIRYERDHPTELQTAAK